jgi:hypothetical protein
LNDYRPCFDILYKLANLITVALMQFSHPIVSEHAQ